MKTRTAAALAKRTILALALLALGAIQARAGTLDLTRAALVAPDGVSAREQQAITMLLDEARKRSPIQWTLTNRWPGQGTPAIAVGTASLLRDCGVPVDEQALSPGLPEGFQLRANAADSSVLVIGNDERGVMFGVGRLLRTMRMTPKGVTVQDDLKLVTAPQSRLRGHQLGYRPKTNSYDAWDVSDWEQYFRDLIVFGCNAIELIPPRSDDDADSPNFPRPPMEMMIEMSRLADRYGLDVWIWYPAMDRDYSNPDTVAGALKEWGEVFRKLPRIDAVFVPGGDPGHTQPRYLMRLLEEQTRNLHQLHPRAEMWVSPQSFNAAWMDEFMGILREQKPAWLSGLVYGPQVRVALPALREMTPSQYPIRHYPDITHSRQCQYPVPDWDVAYAVTEARECINPRPVDEAAIFRATWRYTVGFITYSEGCNDDVNKAVWSALGWDPEAKLVDILRDYGRYFIGAAMDDNFAQGLLALERNWRGSLLSNSGVNTTLGTFEGMERAATPAQLKNWRFQQALFRACYDAHVRARLLHETDLEGRAVEALRRAEGLGSLEALAAAEGHLTESTTHAPAPELRQRLFELGAALHQSIGMQLSVSKYRAIAVDRGAALDTVDFPLNNRVWLRQEFARVRLLKTEGERLTAIRRLVDWENPGPGGFYDDLGNPARQPHLVRSLDFAGDPGAFRSPRTDYEEDLVVDDEDPAPQGARRVSWMDHAEILYDAPLQLRYTDLDPAARYRVRVVYAGDNPRRQIRLVANDGLEVHPLLPKPTPFRPLEFDVPPAATASGTLTLSWYGEPGLGGNGRGCQVSEVWLVKGR